MANLTNSAKLIEKIEGLNVTKVGSSAPSNPSEGTLWYDTTNDVLKSYDGTSWKEVGDTGIHVVRITSLSSSSDATNVVNAIKDYGFENVLVLYTYLDQSGDNQITRYYYPEKINSDTESGSIGYDFRTYEGNTLYTYTVANFGTGITPGAYNSSLDLVGKSEVITKTNTTAFTPTGNYHPATKKYVDDSISTAVASAYKYKGSVSTYSALPASGNTTGDVWNVTDTDMNYAWTGTAWDQLGSTVDLSNYLAKNNTTAFTPSGDYNPATKKYVDDSVSSLGKGVDVVTQSEYNQLTPEEDKAYFIKQSSGGGTTLGFEIVEGANKLQTQPTLCTGYFTGGTVGQTPYATSVSGTISISVTADKVTMINSPTLVSAYWTRNGDIYSFQINQYTLDGCKMALKLESANGDVGYVCISINGND